MQTNPPLSPLALEYLVLVRAQRTRTSPSAVIGHLFKILRRALAQPAYWDLRERLGRVQVSALRHLAGKGEGEGKSGVSGRSPNGSGWMSTSGSARRRGGGLREADARHATHDGAILFEVFITVDAATGLAVLPHWLAQPHFRPLKAPVEKTRGKYNKGAKKDGETMSGPEAQEQEQAPAKCPTSGKEAESKRMKLDVGIGNTAGEAVAIAVAA
ncbi:hypothetical protein D9615_009889 [Tricholomella constricta]|uniref:Uncharacterized protein n=1 Tax=Tricholomella constricta TaxID=117010 RepID=A0A8H5GZI7_9AGAR|nr:hypothetical protein D9615_009889 [Tricholomella constricta]